MNELKKRGSFRISADEMDSDRQKKMAYQYLCHLEEAKSWIENCINDTLPQTTEFEESLRNGVYLAKLSQFFAPKFMSEKSIYDVLQTRYHSKGLEFRHTENINLFLVSLNFIKFPRIFHPETTDIYEKKNMPRLIYCIHALSFYLFQNGSGPLIKNLMGQVKFTEEEIREMCKELQKCGTSLPLFGNIGKVLSKYASEQEDMTSAINKALNSENMELLQENLRKFSKKLGISENFSTTSLRTYAYCLLDFYNGKLKHELPATDSKSFILSETDIHSCITRGNSSDAIQRICQAVNSCDETELMSALGSNVLQIKELNISFAKLYLERFKSEFEKFEFNNNEDDLSNKKKNYFNVKTVQELIQSVHHEDSQQKKAAVILFEINNMLSSDQNDSELCVALKSSTLNLPEINDFVLPFYIKELKNLKKLKGCQNFSCDELKEAILKLSTTGFINEALKNQDHLLFVECLARNSSRFDEIFEEYDADYFMEMTEAWSKENYFINRSGSINFLTHSQLQDIINIVNIKNGKEQALDEIRLALQTNQEQKFAAYLNKYLKNSLTENLDLYFQYFTKNFLNGTFTFENMIKGIDICNHLKNRMKASCNVLQALHHLLVFEERNLDSFMSFLEQLNVKDIHYEYSDLYFQKLSNIFKANLDFSSRDHDSAWIKVEVDCSLSCYINLLMEEVSWALPKHVHDRQQFLSISDIEEVIVECNRAMQTETLQKKILPSLIVFQAQVRGYLVRKEINNRLCHFKENEDKIIKIQSWYRESVNSKNHAQRLAFFKSIEDYVVKLQSYVRMCLARRRYLKSKNFFSQRINSIVIIQRFWKKLKAQRDFQSLLHDPNPSMKIVKKFIHLLDITHHDFNEELKLQTCKSNVVRQIRENKNLEKAVSSMDIKIGLLIKNRVSLQDVITYRKKLKALKKIGAYRDISSNGVMSSKLAASRKRKNNYENLFYVLQTNPIYLAKLIFAIPQSQTTKFMETVVLTLFNYGSNHRDEFLLLKLFETALREEIKCKVEKVSDIVSGNPMVIKMVIAYNRNASGQNCLRQMLEPYIKKVLNDKNLQINTNPVDVYKSWIIEMESESGEASGIPYEISTEEALNCPEVQARMEQSVTKLKQLSIDFCEAILSSLNLMPYGLLYVSKVLFRTLSEKFPDVSEREILKIVGNLLYYRFINPAIVAPEVYDIITLDKGQVIGNEQRRNLGCIAKVIQYAATNKGFSVHNPHLASLNPFIKEIHKKFKKLFFDACQVKEPEVIFSINEFSEHTLLHKPYIYMTAQEICDTHILLIENQDIYNMTEHGELLEILSSFDCSISDKPKIEDMFDIDIVEEDVDLNHLASSEILLILSNKFEVNQQKEDELDMNNLFIKTKQMIIELIRGVHKDSFQELMESNLDDEDESSYYSFLNSRNCCIKSNSIDHSKTVDNSLSREPNHSSYVSVKKVRKNIRQNLRILQSTGYMTVGNSYQNVLNIIVKDICNRQEYLKKRRKEIYRFEETEKQLLIKANFYKEQLDYYNQYVEKCFENLNVGLNKDKKNDGTGKVKAKIKYTALKLQEKGIIHEIEGLPYSQFKNVEFEISSTGSNGVFSLKTKLKGIVMDTETINIQDLLQLQYDGVTIYKIFDKAKININLLLYLLNSKFYSHKK